MNETLDYCDCLVVPVPHVHILTQGEMDEARATWPHIHIVHEFECQCFKCAGYPRQKKA